MSLDPSLMGTLIGEIEEKRKIMVKLMLRMESCLEQLRKHNDVKPQPASLVDGVEEKNVFKHDKGGAQVDWIVRDLQSNLAFALPQLKNLEHTLEKLPESSENTSQSGIKVPRSESREQGKKWPLLPEEYKRYARQLILPEIQLEGQLRLKSTSILIIGVGGLGCPAAAYLAGAGVGHIGLVDGDVVEASNLHRQILHSTRKVGMTKVDSAIEYLRDLNSLVKLTPHRELITSQTALSLLASYDLVLDCTDNPATRYLISDACVLLRKPLVSASALRTDGQLMVLNNPPLPVGEAGGGPCYRCIFPKPPPADTVITCGEGGILGPVVGVMGVLQALEAVKVITTSLPVHYSKSVTEKVEQTSPTTPSAIQPTLLIFSATSQPPFRHIRLRPRRANCAACSATATITPDSLNSGSLDYVQFCGAVAPVDILSPQERMPAKGYVRQYTQNASNLEQNTDDPIVVDVRPVPHFSIYSLPDSINVPFTDLSRWTNESVIPEVMRCQTGHGTEVANLSQSRGEGGEGGLRPIHVICAQGNDSQHAVRMFKSLGLDAEGRRFIGDIEGGWRAIRNEHRLEEGGEGWPEI